MKQMFMRGLMFGVGVVLVLGFGYSAAAFLSDTREKAVKGAEAYAFIEAQIRAQQQAQTPKETK